MAFLTHFGLTFSILFYAFFIGEECLAAPVVPYIQDVEISLRHNADSFRVSRQLREENPNSGVDDAVINGIRLEKPDPDTRMDEAGIVVIPSERHISLRFFGKNLSPNTRVAFTKQSAPREGRCSEALSESFEAHDVANNSRSAVFDVRLETLSNPAESYYICIGTHINGSSTSGTNVPVWHHQGSEPWLQVKAEKVSPYLLPLWLQITIILILLSLSGLFSGLNLGLMTLDPTELKIVLNCGSDKERRYAKAIMPLRKKGNFLLCTLLLGNVLVNSTMTILMDDITSGLVAVIGSTLAIVIFGEIVPQALCSRHGMAVGARTIWLTKLFMILTSPLSYPISKILDKVLGAEIGQVYNRDRLMELIKVTHGYNELELEEVNIISGALELKKKKVESIMTPLDKVFMIPYDAVLDFDTVSEIMKQGYTRVPVYDGTRTNIVALLNIKDLALVDPDDNTPVKTVCKFYNHHVRTVFNDATLDLMLDEFKKGRSHMAFVQRVITEGDGDPYYETVGVVTLEDVIEEIIQSEIEDETDITKDNDRRLRRRDFALAKPDLPIFTGQTGPQYQSLITPQLQLATFQFLSTSLDPFREELIAPTILKRLLRNPDTARFVKVKPDDPAPLCLYTSGRPADYFILILEGRVEVKVGSEKLLFMSGPFTYFGTSVLFTGDPEKTPAMSPTSTETATVATPAAFVPDFTVYPVTDLLYLLITRTQYVAAYRASLEMNRTSFDRGTIGRNEGRIEEPLVNIEEFDKVKRRSISKTPDAMRDGLKRGSLMANSNVSLDKLNATPIRDGNGNLAKMIRNRSRTLSSTDNESVKSLIEGKPNGQLKE